MGHVQKLLYGNAVNAMGENIHTISRKEGVTSRDN